MRVVICYRKASISSRKKKKAHWADSFCKQFTKDAVPLGSLSALFSIYWMNFIIRPMGEPWLNPLKVMCGAVALHFDHSTNTIYSMQILTSSFVCYITAIVTVHRKRSTFSHFWFVNSDTISGCDRQPVHVSNNENKPSFFSSTKRTPWHLSFV